MTRPLHRSAPTFVLLGATLMLGCVDRITTPIPDLDAAREYADLVCRTEADCGCQAFDSVEACEEFVTSAFIAVGSKAQFDRDCFDAHMAAGFWTTCTGALEVLDLPTCDVFVGNQSAGSPCEFRRLPGYLDPHDGCVDSLFCSPISGECSSSNPIDSQEPGDPCVGPRDSCRGFYEELYCDDGTCAVRVGKGEPCDDPNACATFSFCAGLSDSNVGTCAPMPEVGEACDPSVDGVCRSQGSSHSWCNPSSQVCENPKPFVCDFFE